MSEITSASVDIEFTLPLHVPLPEALRFPANLALKQVRGRARRVLVTDLWLADSEYVWVSGPIVLKVTDQPGTYQDEGWVFLADVPDHIRAHILDVILDGVVTE